MSAATPLERLARGESAFAQEPPGGWAPELYWLWLADLLRPGFAHTGRVLDACDHSACRARRPAVLVVQICAHLFLFGFIDARFNKAHKFFAEIRRGKPATNVHMVAAETHFFELFGLPKQVVFIEIVVPCPERRAPILARGVFEQFV